VRERIPKLINVEGENVE